MFGKLNSKMKGKLFKSLVASYIFILILPLVMAIFFYNTSMGIIEREIENAAIESLNQYSRMMDTVFQQVRSIGVELETNDKVSTIIYADDINNKRRFDIYELYTGLNNYYGSNFFTKSLFLYGQKNDLLITKQGQTELDLYMEQGIGIEDTYRDLWIDALRAPNHEGFFALQRSDDRYDIVYLRQFIEANQVIGNIGVVIDTKKVTNLMDTTKWMDDSTAYIMDKSGKSIIQTASEGLVPRRPETLTEATGKLDKQFLNGETMLVFSTPSEISDYDYVLTVPEALFYSKTKALQKGIVVFTLLCLFFGGGLAMWFTNRNYNPVFSILQMLEDQQSLSVEGKDEIVFIHESLKTVMTEIKKANTQVETQTMQLRNQFFRRVLNGTYQNTEEINELLEIYGVEFGGDEFVCSVIYVEGDDSLLKNSAYSFSKNTLNDYIILIEKIYQELLEGEAYCHIVEMGKYFIVLISYQTMVTKSDKILQIKKASIKAKEIFSANFGLYVSIALSNSHHGIGNISNAYNQAMNTMEYTLLYGKDNVIDYDNTLKNTHKGDHGLYSLDRERQLVSLLRNGAFSEAFAVLDMSLDQLVVNGNSVEHTKCTVFAMMNTINNVFNEMSTKVNGTWEEQLNTYMKRIIHCSAIAEIRGIMKELFKVAESNYKTNDAGRDRVSEICKFIHNNYHDYNLNVSMVADVFDMNIANLSATFKQVKGINLSSFLSQYRLDKAKSLMENNQLTIKEIACMCGFGDSGTFIRVFKKYEGITPGRARKSKITKKA